MEIAYKTLEILRKIFINVFPLQINQEILNTMHGYLLQILYLLRSMIQKSSDLKVETLIDITQKLGQLKLSANNVIRKTYLEILLEILLRYFSIDP